MSSKKKNESFSFDNAPGKLPDDQNADFTFADIPVLGDNKKKDLFSFDDLPEENEDKNDDPSIASFEALLAEQPKKEEEENEDEHADDISALDATASVMDVQRMVKSRGAKQKRKKMVVMASIVSVVILTLIAVVPFLLKSSSDSKTTQGEKELTPAEKEKRAKQKRAEKIATILKSANAKLAAGETEKALSSFKRVISMNKKESTAYTGAGKCYEKLKDIKAAKEHFQKAIDATPKNSAPYYYLEKLLTKEKKSEEVKELFKEAHQRFPTDSEVALTLGNIYYDIKEENNAIDVYNTVKDRSKFTEDAVEKFTSLLKQDSKKRAEELLLYAGKKFKNASFFISASQISDSPKNKVKVLQKALKILPPENPHIPELKFLLSEAQIGNGNKSEATVTMKSIDLSKLDKKYCQRLVDLALKAGMTDIKNYCLKLLKSNPNEIALQESILQELAKTQPPEDLLAIYSSWLKKNTREPVANYLYAIALGNSNSAKRYFEDAIALNSNFYEAIVALAKIHINREKLTEAKNQLQKAIKLKPKKKEPRKLLAIVNTGLGKGTKAITEYADYLSTTEISDTEKAIELFDIAILMKTPTMAEKYLRQIKKDPALSQQFRERNAEKKLIFGGISASDFTGQKTGKLRQYYILHLLSKGKYSTVIKLRTSKEEFPEFWKIYLMKKEDIKTWKSLSELYYKKNIASGDPAKLLIISMWLGKKTIEEVEDQIKYISPDKRGILYAIIAEEYFRQKKITKATVRFKKAKRARKSIYNGTIKQIYNSLRKRR